MVRFCLAMCLFYDDDYEEVARKLASSLRTMRSGRLVARSDRLGDQPGRARLGAEPMRELFERVAAPVAGYGTKGAWLRSRRLMAVDGFTLDVPDTASNNAAFGTSSTGNRTSPYPQVRVVGLAECGSHALVAAALGNAKTHEQTLLPQLLGALEPDMLLLTDRGFYSYQLWHDARETEADCCGGSPRTSACGSAGTFRRHLLVGDLPGRIVHTPPRDDPRISQGRRPVHPLKHLWSAWSNTPSRNRMGDRKRDTIRLITSILDPADIPAIELAAASTNAGRSKSCSMRSRPPARARTGTQIRIPDLVQQEVWHCCRPTTPSALDVSGRRRSRRRPRPTVLRQNPPDHPPPHHRQRIFPPDTRAEALAETITDITRGSTDPAGTNRHEHSTLHPRTIPAQKHDTPASRTADHPPSTYERQPNLQP